ncbi:MAG: class I SAM-dependent methyltransferase [Spirochaetaceae bacterium]|nr:class I SAM-dependent methyltransferase [Spirochaetaceae bacterium]
MMFKLIKKIIKACLPYGIVMLVMKQRNFPGSKAYWERRYAEGGNSGAGSYNRLAAFKAEMLNAFVRDNNIQTVMEFGCGDGNQLSLARYPRYTGFDVSETAVKLCKNRFKGDATKTFYLLNATPPPPVCGIGSFSGCALSFGRGQHIRGIYRSFVRDCNEVCNTLCVRC